MMKRILAINFGRWEKKLTRWTWLILRVGIALLMLRHGFDKLIKFSEMAPRFVDPLGIGSQVSLALVVGTEFFASLFLLIGLLTRWSSLSLLFTMLIAGLVVHGSDPFSHKELALFYALVFLCFSLAGGGCYSVDHYLKKKLK